jgi:Mn2+/Fe2+ NRAMP family transporter
MSQRETFIRKKSAEAPTGWNRIRSLTPGLVWMVSSIGSGTILFTPRIGARYEYELLWMALVVTVLIYIIIREVGRFTLVTGKSILSGFSELPGPAQWGLWILFAPQLVAACITVSGLAMLAGSSLISTVGGNAVVYALIIILGCLMLIVSGRFPLFEKTASVMAGLLISISLITAMRVVAQWDAIGSGLVPSVSDDFEIGFVLPWVGFYLAGAAGIIWYSYWVAAREYGGPLLTKDEIDTIREGASLQHTDEKVKNLKRWISILNTTSLIGIISGGLINVAFLILGAELLAPEGIIPEGVDVADDLALLLSEVWGETGRWFLLISILIALLGSVLSNQDGYGRMFYDATLIGGINLVQKFAAKIEKMRAGGPAGPDTARRYISNVYRLLFTAVLPAAIYIWFRDPVKIMSVAGIISAIHIPFLIFGIAWLNKRRIPKELQPNAISYVLLWTAGLFYFVLGAYQVADMF